MGTKKGSMGNIISGIAAVLIGMMGSAVADPEKSTLRAITIDGDFSDWEGIAPLVTSGSGSSSGINFGRVWAANDQDYLYLKFEVGRETIWQEPTSLAGGNDIRILIDGNANSSSGAFMEGIDVNFEIGLGDRYTEFHWSGSNSSTYNFSRAGILGLPTHSSDTFEFRIPRTIRPFSTDINVITGNTIRFVLVDGSGSRVPSSGSIQYTMAGGSVPAPEPISFERMDAGDVRVLVHNAEDTAPADPAIRPYYEQYLLAMQPDIICFQEIYSPNEPQQRPDVTLRWTPQQARNWIASFLDPSPGDQWYVAGSGDNVTISKWPIIGTAGTTRFLAAHIDMPEGTSLHNLVIFNVHTPCCQNNSGRDAVHDEISFMWRNLLNGTGPFVIDPDAAVLMVGDFNMVGFVRQLETIRDGRIINPGNWGPSFSPARQDGSLTSAPLRHSHARDIYTWRRLGPSFSQFAPGKLDYVFFSGDVMELRRNFILDTSTTPQSVLNQYNMTADLSESASDHLVMVTDFEFPRLEEVEHGNQWLIQ